MANNIPEEVRLEMGVILCTFAAKFKRDFPTLEIADEAIEKIVVLLAPIVEKRAREEIIEEILKRAYPEDEGLEFYFSSKDWRIFQEKYLGRRICRRCGAERDDDIDSDICGNCADDLRQEDEALKERGK
jgi:hypothetical protein